MRDRQLGQIPPKRGPGFAPGSHLPSRAGKNSRWAAVHGGHGDRRPQASGQKELRQMRIDYEIRSGRRTVARKQAATPREALIDYVRGIGCREDEIRTMG